MIVLKEIKHKEYLKGTKALKVRNYLGIGLAFLFVLPGIPLYYIAQRDKPKFLEEVKKKEEARAEKAQIMFQLQSSLYEMKKHPDPHHNHDKKD